MVRTHRFENWNLFFCIIGLFIVDWLSCRVNSQSITRPFPDYPKVRLGRTYNSRKIKCENFNIEKKKIMLDMNTRGIRLRQHHIVLRQKKSSKPILIGSDKRITTTGKFFKLLITPPNVIFLFSESLV